MINILLSRSGLLALAFAGRSQAFAFPTAPSTTRLQFSFLQMSTAKQVLVPIADGSEEIETTCITDTLTRFGASVTIASVMPDLTCTMSRGIKIVADVSIQDVVGKDWDLIALPGGMPGAEHLRDSKELIDLLEKQNNAGKLYAAVCASPAVVLASKGLATPGATCYPAEGFRATLSDPVDDEVVVKDNLVTSKGPGTSLKFSLVLGEKLYGKEKADEIAKAMLVQR